MQPFHPCPFAALRIRVSVEHGQIVVHPARSNINTSTYTRHGRMVLGGLRFSLLFSSHSSEWADSRDKKETVSRERKKAPMSRTWHIYFILPVSSTQIHICLSKGWQYTFTFTFTSTHSNANALALSGRRGTVKWETKKKCVCARVEMLRGKKQWANDVWKPIWRRMETSYPLQP